MSTRMNRIGLSEMNRTELFSLIVSDRALPDMPNKPKFGLPSSRASKYRSLCRYTSYSLSFMNS